MASDVIRVNTGSLKQTQESISSQLSNINNKIMKMRQDVIALNRMWSGPANSAFNQAFLEDLEKLSEVCSCIMHTANYEANAAREYNLCEQKVESLIADIEV